jgi:hypothetical protein
MKPIDESKQLTAIRRIERFKRRHRQAHERKLTLHEKNPRKVRHPGEYKPPTYAAIAAALPSDDSEEKWTETAVRYLLKRQKETEVTTFRISTLLDGIEQRSIVKVKVKQLLAARDPQPVFKEFLHELGFWISDVLRLRNMSHRSDLVPELAIVGANELWRKIESAVKNPKNGVMHLRNSLRQAIKAELHEHLNKLHLVTSNSSTLKKRRAKARKTAGNNRPACDRRPADMPERIETRWSGYHSFECHERELGDLRSIERQNPEAFCQLDSEDKWLLINNLKTWALALSKGKLWEAITFILDAPWVERKLARTSGWEKRGLSAAAKHVGWTVWKLKCELSDLGKRIVEHISPSELNHAKRYFNAALARPQKFLLYFSSISHILPIGIWEDVVSAAASRDVEYGESYEGNMVCICSACHSKQHDSPSAQHQLSV